MRGYHAAYPPEFKREMVELVRSGRAPEERQELRQLKREVRQLRMERDILRKAAAWFARESNSIPDRDSSS